MRMLTKTRKLFLVALLAAAVGLAGCADDGNNGAAGLSAFEIAQANGFTGTEQEWLDSLQGGQAVFTSTPREACNVCHGDTGLAEVETVHDFGVGDLQVLNVTPTVVGADLQVTFNVQFNGNDRGGYTSVTRQYRLDDTLTRNTLVGTILASATVEDPPDSDILVTTYTLTIPGAGAVTNSRFLFRVEDPLTPEDASRRAILTFDFPASPVVDVLGDVACANCHGSLGNGFHYGTPVGGGKACVVCHDAVNTTYPRYYPMIHGIHNSHNMPTGEFQLFDNNVPAELVATYSIGFPSYMQNCSLCHSTPAALAVTNAEPVTFDFCMTCHQNFNGFGTADFLNIPHGGFTAATNCSICHDGATAFGTHAGAHNANSVAVATDRGGLVWDGVDLSVTQGARVVTEFTQVVRTGNDLAIDWTVAVDGALVDPCNTVVGTSAPTFQSGFSILKAFYQGDDLANANNGNAAPGQPNSTNLNFTAGTGNTVCVGTTATTTVPFTAAEALLTGKGRIALQGRPTLTVPTPGGTTPTQNILVRAKTPVYDFDVATGAAATPRRIVVDNQKCIDCHTGSLYQHGGNRIDNEELCMMCHNESSSEQNRREGMGVTAAEAYDGKAGQTYGFKTMLHGIHATGVRGTPFVWYRSNGIYAFAGSEAFLRNWPGTGIQTVFGSGPDGTNPVTTRNHNFVTAHFPRRINDCAACHVDNFNRMPNPTTAMATTVHAGVEPFDNQLDDALEGVTAAACGSCHTSTVAFEQNALKAHFYSNGWTPQVFPAGRQTIIEANQ